MQKSSTKEAPKGKRLSIGIVGGGIGGVALAIGLSRDKSLEVNLFEAAAKFSEIGAGVSFGPNAVRSISLLGLEEPYTRIADKSPQPFEDVWFEWRRWHDEGYLAASIAPGCGQSSVHRADFLDALVQCLPEGIAHFGKRCAAVRQDPEGVTVDFEDGTTFQCDILIGCDGIKSAVRRHVLPEESYGTIEPRWSGTKAYRGLVPVEELKRAFTEVGVEARLATVPQMYLGPQKHILTFPVKQSTLINVVAFVSDRTSATPQLPAGEPWVVEVSQAEMLEDFADWGEASKAILRCIPEPTRWALHELPELPCHVRDRVLLIGDAAHAMLPHQGAGAGQALEDAYVLASLLTDERCTRDNAAQVLTAFERCRRPRACRVQATSREAGEVYEYCGEGIGSDEEKLADDLKHRFDWIWNYDPRAGVREALAPLGWQETVSCFVSRASSTG